MLGLMLRRPNISAGIKALIVEHALCRSCIAAQTQTTPDTVDDALADLSDRVKIDRYAQGVCSECGSETLVFAIDRPPRR
jgi:hypothetical protein